jgi:hypothetical protein
VATKLGYDPDAIPLEEQAIESPRFAESGDAPAAVLSQAKEQLLKEQTAEPPMPKPYPGFVRVGILVGGAIACWAAVVGVLALAG